MFRCFGHEIQLFKVVSSLKVVRIYVKMYLNFQNFQGQMSGGGGQALVGKWGRVPDGGGIDQIFVNWGDPPVPPPTGKKNLESTGICEPC